MLRCSFISCFNIFVDHSITSFVSGHQARRCQQLWVMKVLVTKRCSMRSVALLAACLATLLISRQSGAAATCSKACSIWSISSMSWFNAVLRNKTFSAEKTCFAAVRSFSFISDLALASAVTACGCSTAPTVATAACVSRSARLGLPAGGGVPLPCPTSACLPTSRCFNCRCAPFEMYGSDMTPRTSALSLSLWAASSLS